MSIYDKEYKGFLVKPHKQFPSTYIVAVAGQGGSIPTVLEGMFTKSFIAEAAIDKYLESKEEVKNDKTRVKGRSK